MSGGGRVVAADRPPCITSCSEERNQDSLSLVLGSALVITECQQNLITCCSFAQTHLGFSTDVYVPAEVAVVPKYLLITGDNQGDPASGSHWRW